MKRLSILGALISIVLLTSVSGVYGQNRVLQLAVTPYTTQKDLNVIFDKSSRMLQILGKNEDEQKITLSLVTEFQKTALVSEGLQPRIIDPDTDINRYVLLYHPQKDQSGVLAGLGEVFVLTPHYTLLKLPVGQKFTHEGAAAQFFDIPFPETIAKPPNRSGKKPTIPPISPTIVPAISHGVWFPPSWAVAAVIVYIFAVVVSLFIVWRNKTISTRGLLIGLLFVIVTVIGMLLFILLHPKPVKQGRLRKDLDVDQLEAL